MPDFSASRGGVPLTRRAPSNHDNSSPGSSPPLKIDVEPAPKPWPFAPALALLLVLCFISLQFILPATHVRDPWDPHRNWILKDQFGSKTQESSQVSNTADKDDSQSRMSEPNIESFLTEAEKRKGTPIFVWTEETDLRPLAVIVNSTISNTRHPKNYHFHFIVPGSLTGSAHFKLKTIFPDIIIELVRDGAFLEKMMDFMAFQRADKEIPKSLDLLPFYLPKMFPDVERFIYLGSDIVLQGNVEELLQVDLQGHAVAAVEDCSQHFETYFEFELLEVARESQENGKPWMPAQPYDPETCTFDRGAIVFDAKAWNQKNLTEAVEWWIDQFHKTERTLYRNGFPELPVLLALYQNYKKLDAAWNVREPLAFQKADAAKLIHFDGKSKPWHHARLFHPRKDVAGFWWNYLSPPADQMLKL